MKKNQVKAILIDQTIRRKNILYRALLLFFILSIASIFFLVFFNENKDYVVGYTEKGNINYNVFLKQNDYFKSEFLGDSNKYISNLIDYIQATFDYELAMDDYNVDYKYSYVVEAEVDVKEIGSTKSLYNSKEKLQESEVKYSNGAKKVSINEKFDIDYNKYNDLISEFVSIYNLDKTESTLTLNMYINVVGSCDEFTNDENTKTIITMQVPLNTKTVGIDVKNNINEADENVVVCNSATPAVYIYLLIFAVLVFFGVIVAIDLTKYIITTRTAENIYDLELKKILNNYHSFIQKVSNNVNIVGSGKLEIDNLEKYKDCQVYRLETFTDLLEIRDNINAPILMSSNAKNTATYFTIFDVSNKSIYLYSIKVSEIKKQMKENAAIN